MRIQFISNFMHVVCPVFIRLKMRHFPFDENNNKCKAKLVSLLFFHVHCRMLLYRLCWDAYHHGAMHIYAQRTPEAVKRTSSINFKKRIVPSLKLLIKSYKKLTYTMRSSSAAAIPLLLLLLHTIMHIFFSS